MHNDIIQKVEEIVSYIKETTEYKNYLKAQELLKNDKELMSLIIKIKNYQKEIIRNQDKKNELEIKIQKTLETLRSSPLYCQYEECQDSVNNMLTIFENKINKYFEDVFN